MQPSDREQWLTPAPMLVDPVWRVYIYERWDGRFVISVRTPLAKDGTTMRTVLL